MMTYDDGVELKNSSLWEKVVVELNDRVDKCLQQLKVCGPEEFQELQMRIKGYEELRNLPQDVIDRNDNRT